MLFFAGINKFLEPWRAAPRNLRGQEIYGEGPLLFFTGDELKVVVVVSIAKALFVYVPFRSFPPVLFRRPLWESPNPISQEEEKKHTDGALRLSSFSAEKNSGRVENEWNSSSALV